MIKQSYQLTGQVKLPEQGGSRAVDTNNPSLAFTEPVHGQTCRHTVLELDVDHLVVHHIVVRPVHTPTSTAEVGFSIYTSMGEKWDVGKFLYRSQLTHTSLEDLTVN